MASPSSEPDTTEDLLIAYALGALDPAEMQQVSELLRGRPELQQQLNELRHVATLLPYGLPEATPPADLRQRVLDHATGEKPLAARSKERRAWGGWLRSPWFVGLSGALAALLLALVLFLQFQLSTQQAEIQQQQQLIAQQQQLAAQQQQLVALLTSPGARFTPGEGNAGSATLVHSGTSAAVVAALAPLPNDRTYQLWLITDPKASPIGAGTFEVDPSGHGLLVLPTNQPALAEARVFAITNEPAGGSPAPTGDILVSGEIGVS